MGVILGFDIVYIDDVVAAFILAAEQLCLQTQGQKIFGISSGHTLRLMDIKDKFELITGYKLKINWGGRPYREREVMLTWNKFEKLPGWCPTISLEEGLIRSLPKDLKITDAR